MGTLTGAVAKWRHRRPDGRSAKYKAQSETPSAGMSPATGPPDQQVPSEAAIREFQRGLSKNPKFVEALNRSKKHSA